MTRVRSWGFRLLALVAGLASAAGLLEGLSAIVYHYEKQANEAALKSPAVAGRIEDGGGHDPDAYVYYRNKPDQRHPRFQTNRFGLRNGEITDLPADGTLRILLLGGSVTWGYTSQSNRDTVSHYLEERLNHGPAGGSGLHFEVLNGGVAGYVSWQQSLSYALYQRRLRPHLIITLDGANDVAAGLAPGEAGFPLGYDVEASSRRGSRPGLIRIFSDWLQWRFQRSKFYKLLFEKEIPRMAITRRIRRYRPLPLTEIQPPTADQIAQAYRGALQHLVDVAGFDGGTVIAVLQPVLILPESKMRTPFEENVRREMEARFPGISAYYSNNFEELRKVIRSLKSNNPNLRTLDASLLFKSESTEIFVDYCHLTPTGRRLLATALAVEIERLPLGDLLVRKAGFSQ